MTAAVGRGPTLPHGYGAGLQAVTDAAATVTPAQMPGAKCGRTTGLYRCVRKADHGGNCQMQRRDDADLAEDDGETAPEPDTELLAVQAVVNSTDRLARVVTGTPLDLVRGPAKPSTTPYQHADLLEVAAKALRLSGNKHLVVDERGHAAALAASIVQRVNTATSSRLGVENTAPSTG